MHNFRDRQHLIASLKQQGIWLLIYVVIFGVIAWLCTEVWERESFSFDRAFLLWLHQFANSQLDRIFLSITSLGNPPVVIAVGISTIGWLVMKRKFTDLLRFLFICVGGIILNQEMKLFFAKPRPELWPRLINEHSFSFPSGHAVGSMLIYGFLGYMLAKELPVYRRYIYTGAAVLIMAIGLSRLYLGVHYPTDIIAGYGIGFLWLTACLKIRS